MNHQDKSTHYRCLLLIRSAVLFVAVARSATAMACTGSQIAIENCRTDGVTPQIIWDVAGHGDEGIQGFADPISVDNGSTVAFKINSKERPYTLDIYRLGYYGGNGARRVASLSPSTTVQPDCGNVVGDSTTKDCGNWAVSASWNTPSNATSGIYIARIAIAGQPSMASHIVFIVRDDTGNSDLLFQTSDTTWQAYNTSTTSSFVGAGLYTGAHAVSYNRPFETRDAILSGVRDWLFNAEYPMLRWLERNGYDMSYISGADTASSPNKLLQGHRVFLSVGHDEYWSKEQRANVEYARSAGVNLAFFSGNEIYWKTRWSNSNRTLICYKENEFTGKLDPSGLWTGTWSEQPYPLYDTQSPENALSGVMFAVNGPRTADSIIVPEADGKMRFWRNTSLATLSPNTSKVFAAGTLGMEWDSVPDNAVEPAGLIQLSTSVVDVQDQQVMEDAGGNSAFDLAPDIRTHHMTLYRHASGALVFGAGTIQWAWGLDTTHDVSDADTPVPEDHDMQQATVNLFADMGVSPSTLQSGLLPASASTDTQAPTSTITQPTSGTLLQPGRSITISGTAQDTGGGVVGGVEVSVDGGNTWHRATGRSSWSYSWFPHVVGGVATIVSRAVDDSGNTETPLPAHNVTINFGQTGVLFYNATSGRTLIYRTNGAGNLLFPETMNTLLSPGATKIVAGRFTSSLNSDLFFYNKQTGACQFFRSNGSGQVSPLPALTCLTGWTDIVIGRFTNSAYSDLLFYNKATGAWHIERTDGLGHLNALIPTTYYGVAPNGIAGTNWTTIVAGHFAGDSYSNLLFYDASSGISQIYRTDGNGNIFLLTSNIWSQGWSSVVPATLDSDEYTDLLFYNGTSGQVVMQNINRLGQLAFPYFTQYSLEPNWTATVSGNFNGDAFSDVLLYNATSGASRFYSTDGSSHLGVLANNTWSTNWNIVTTGIF
jgi:hypothetical protein